MQSEQRVTGEAPSTRSVAGNVIRGSLGNLIERYDTGAAGRGGVDPRSERCGQARPMPAPPLTKESQ
jgi:hypothetical protein